MDGYAARTIGALSVLVLMAAPVGSASAQDGPTPGAVLVGTLFDSTALGPLSGAVVYLMDTPHVTVADSEGAFALAGLDGGEYTISVRHARFDSIGVSVPPTWEIDLPATGVTRVELAVPSMATLLPGLCGFGEPGTRGISVGRVRDAATGTPLPHASVQFDADGMDTRTVEADSEGRYLACGLRSGLPVATRATFFRRAPAVEVLAFVDDHPVVRDFELALSPGVEVHGRVVDESNGAPVAGAVVTVESAAGEVGRVLSDDDGQFALDRIELDTYLVKVQHIAYGAQTKWFTVSDVVPLELELGLVPDAITLDALVVSVQSRGLGVGVDEGVRRDFVSRLEIERLLGSVRNVGDLVRTIPGVRVQNLRDPVTGQMRLCVEGRRTATGRCDSVLVVIDGVMSDPEMLEDLSPNIIESIEFVPSIIAGMRFGTRTGSGVLDIKTVR